MAWEPRPLPVVTPEAEPFWGGAAEGELRLPTCTACGLTFYYPRAHCPDCLSETIEWSRTSGRGTVYSHTSTEIVQRWPDDHLPLVSAYVELEEGPRMLTALVNCEPAEVEIGLPVEVVFVETEREDVAIPVFEPRGETD